MDFFPEPPPPREDELEPAQPVWLGPPDDTSFGVAPLALILGQSDQVAVMLSGARCFASGISFTLHARLNGPTSPSPNFDLNEELFRHGRVNLGQRGFRWGLELASGQRLTNVDPWPEPLDRSHDPLNPWVPSQALLTSGGGGGSPHSVDQEQWLWPLPPPGAITLVCEWPSVGIERTITTIDADPFLKAAESARPLWP